MDSFHSCQGLPRSAKVILVSIVKVRYAYKDNFGSDMVSARLSLNNITSARNSDVAVVKSLPLILRPITGQRSIAASKDKCIRPVALLHYVSNNHAT